MDTRTQSKRRSSSCCHFFDSSVLAFGVDLETLVPRRLKDPLEPDYVRIPPFPVPLTWARSVEPFSLAPSVDPTGSHYVETNIVDFDLLSFGKAFVGVLLDVPWKTPRLDGPGRVTAAQLVRTCTITINI
jgi:hypothetical protein